MTRLADAARTAAAFVLIVCFGRLVSRVYALVDAAGQDAETEHDLLESAAQLRAAQAQFSLALAQGLVHLDNGEPLRRPVIVRGTSDQLDSAVYAFDALTRLARRRAS